MADLDTAIQENAAGPKKASGDSVSFEQHGLRDQVAADRHPAEKRASRRVLRPAAQIRGTAGRRALHSLLRTRWRPTMPHRRSTPHRLPPNPP